MAVTYSKLTEEELRELETGWEYARNFDVDNTTQANYISAQDPVLMWEEIFAYLKLTAKALKAQSFEPLPSESLKRLQTRLLIEVDELDAIAPDARSSED